jgi:hypothetical protein
MVLMISRLRGFFIFAGRDYGAPGLECQRTGAPRTMLKCAA